MTTITDTVAGTESRVSRVYRVEGDARLYVTADRKIWLGCGDSPERFARAGDLPAGQPMTKQNVCRAANIY